MLCCAVLCCSVFVLASKETRIDTNRYHSYKVTTVTCHCYESCTSCTVGFKRLRGGRIAWQARTHLMGGVSSSVSFEDRCNREGTTAAETSWDKAQNTI